MVATGLLLIRRWTISIAVLVFEFFCSANGICDATENPTPDDALEPFVAFFSQLLAVENYDVRVRKEINRIPAESVGASEVKALSIVEVYRLVHCHSQRKSLILSKQRRETESKETKAGMFEESVRLAWFDDKGYAFRTLNANASNDRVFSNDFERYCGTEKVEAAHFFPIRTPEAYYRGKSLESSVEIFLDTRRNGGRLERFPDGKSRFSQTFKRKGTSETVSSYLFDAELRLLSTSIREAIPGRWIDVLNAHCEYGDNSYPFLATKITYSRPHLLPRANVSEGKSMVPADEVGTIELHWFQVNADQLMFPDREKIGQDVTAWEEFVSPRELRESGKIN